MESLNEYIGADGYQALHKAIFDLDQKDIIDEMKKSGLRGRGGAGFPTGRKWESAYKVENSQNTLFVMPTKETLVLSWIEQFLKETLIQY